MKKRLTEKHFDFAVIIESDKDGYVAFCPELQGCYSQGGTYEEVVLNIKDAIKLHVEDRMHGNEKLPRFTSVSLSTVHISL